MDIDAFPEIENFQKLPKDVIVKAGSTGFDGKGGSSLQGLVINNIGNTICDLRVCIVVFNEKKIPLLNTSTSTDPAVLPQGGMANFRFEFKQQVAELKDFHLFTTWRFDE